MHMRAHNSYGFTLLELLIYIALVSVLLTVVWASIIYEMKSMSENTESEKLYSTQEFLRYKLSAALLGAVNVQTSATAISFDRPDLLSDSPLQFFIQDNTLFLSRGVHPAVPLTYSGDVSVIPGTEPFSFENRTGMLTVRFTLRSKETKIVVYK